MQCDHFIIGNDLVNGMLKNGMLCSYRISSLRVGAFDQKTSLTRIPSVWVMIQLED